MTKICELLNTGIQTGNNVSHSKRRTKRTFLPNLQNKSLYSEVLGKSFSLKIAVATLRTIDHNNGFDNFLLTTSNNKLSETAIKIKKQIKSVIAEKAAA